MAEDMVWMGYPASGGVTQFPVGAAEAWAARGWEPCEAPTEPDPALVEHVPLARVAIVPQIDNGVAFQMADLTPASTETKPSKKTEK